MRDQIVQYCIVRDRVGMSERSNDVSVAPESTWVSSAVSRLPSRKT